MTIAFTKEPHPQMGLDYRLDSVVTEEWLYRTTNERYDSASVAFFLRDLTDIYSRTFDVKFPDLKARQILPIFSGVDAGAEGYVWRQFNRTGVANIIDDFAADLPEAEVKAAEFQSRLYSMGTSYMYSIQDLRKAKMAGIPLEARKAFAARRAMEQAVEQIAFFGRAKNPDTAAGAQALKSVPATITSTDALDMFGLTNIPNAQYTTTTNDWTLPSTSVSTIMNDFNALQKAVVDNSKGVHEPDSMVLPLSLFTKLSTLPRSIAFTDDTVLQYMRKQSPWLRNVYWTTMTEKAGLKQDNTTPGGRVIMFERNSENLELVIPQEFEQLPPQMINLTFKIPCHMRIGGVRCSYPKSIAYLDGMMG